MPSGTPSPSESTGHPVASTVAPLGVLGHVSMPSKTPSPSASVGHPFASTVAPFGVFAHLSLWSGTPSPSVSLTLPPNAHVRPPARTNTLSFDFDTLPKLVTRRMLR